MDTIILMGDLTPTIPLGAYCKALPNLNTINIYME